MSGFMARKGGQGKATWFFDFLNAKELKEEPKEGQLCYNNELNCLCLVREEFLCCGNDTFPCNESKKK